MRYVRLLLGLVTISVLPYAKGQEVTIMQLRAFLSDQHKSRRSDNETADRLSSISLTERLTDQTLSRIITETKPGPESIEQLRFLADYSIFAAPPTNESPTYPAPSPEVQIEMLSTGAKYAQSALQHLPDFLAIRDTRRFDNMPQPSAKKRTPPKIQLHWIGEFKNEIAYRHGTEMVAKSGAQHMTSAEISMHPGLLSVGEFGPILSIVFSDFTQGTVAWSRWEMDSVHGRMAVFLYTVPKSNSHYLVDFCCYTNPEDENRDLSFHDHPAYHGEVVLSPDSGVVRRIAIEADLDASAPIVKSELAVQYGEVEIDGRFYICPVRSIALTDIHHPKMHRIDGVGIERHLNEVKYLDYHKFGSTSRMITNP